MSEGGNSDPHLFDSILLSSTVKKAATNALFTANELRQDLQGCIDTLDNIPPSYSSSEVCSVLSSVKDRVSADRSDAQQITRVEASQALENIGLLVVEVERRLHHWQAQYPDISPIKVDNGAHIQLVRSNPMLRRVLRKCIS
ncbi:hypothetical protein GYMLUDRAFT_65557 [Collybiopsis luxurians FD-317 M1]|uniref:Uncharacterized protein n=1 Tax=Collybiopsis luxurians FD-317 M1 TaxID=944289 RepID=A0A0D0BVU3_9AGAR|nr:hypothetical protein GYMLUDRAFT_65557 [Collybiopsis luxurians FD-317 M1]